MTRRVIGMIAVPLLLLTGYLLWIWPAPGSDLFILQLAPYLFTLVCGAPFVWGLASRPLARAMLLIGYFLLGYIVQFVYAALVLCAFRNMCL